MTLSQLLKDSPAYKRVVLIGVDSRIKKIYDKDKSIPESYLSMKVWGQYLRPDGDFDVKVNLL